MKALKIGLIGGGSLATSLVKGLLLDGHPKDQLWVSNRSQERQHFFANEIGVHATADNQQLASSVDVLILSVKPYQVQAILHPLFDTLHQHQPILLSVAAGLRVHTLKRWLPGKISLIRAMPNTAAFVQCSATGLYAGEDVPSEHCELAESILRTVGTVVWVDQETQLDAITALAGSGPAYYFYMIEKLKNAAIELGLNAKDAELLAVQTAFGASRLALESTDSLELLRKKVTSPKGTTEKAIHILEQENMDKILTKALQASTKRAQEIADELDQTQKME
jgi:pyrroline-5-carboxylate reductase